MFVWSSITPIRFYIAYAINRLDDKPEDMDKEIPLCSSLYKSMKNRLIAFSHPRRDVIFNTKLELFELCVANNYPEWNAKYYAKKREAAQIYEQGGPGFGTFKDRRDTTKSEIKVMKQRDKLRKETELKKERERVAAATEKVSNQNDGKNNKIV